MNKDRQTIAVWASTHRLLQIASALAGVSQVRFIHDALIEKAQRDKLPVPAQYLVVSEDSDNE